VGALCLAGIDVLLHTLSKNAPWAQLYLDVYLAYKQLLDGLGGVPMNEARKMK